MVRTILLVDDDPVLLEIGAESLTAAGFTVVCANDGEQAVPLLRKQSFDLLVLDIEMPLLNGLSLLKWVRASAEEAISSLPVIMLTGRNDEQAIQTCFDFGATSYIAKPVSWLNMAHQIAFVLRAHDDAKALRHAHDAERKLSQAKDGLMMTLRHELRSPLHVIQGFTTLLSKGLSETLSADDLQSFQMIDQTVDGMATKLSRLFLYSETLAGEFDLTPDFTTIARIAGKAAEATRDLATEQRVSVDLDIPDATTIECKADEEKLIIAVSEIINNAIKATSGGGVVTIRLRETPSGVPSVVIEDEGPGVDLDSVERLFEPFVQGDTGLTRTSVGLGLGLSVSKSIVERHGGKIEIGNRADRGACVTVTLPADLLVQRQSAA